MTVLGVLLGRIPVVQRNFEKFVLLVIFVSLLPVIMHACREHARSASPLYSRATKRSMAARTAGSRCASTSSPFATPSA